MACPDVHRGIQATMSRPTENIQEDQMVRKAGSDFGLRRLSWRFLTRQPREVLVIVIGYRVVIDNSLAECPAEDDAGRYVPGIGRDHDRRNSDVR